MTHYNTLVLAPNNERWRRKMSLSLRARMEDEMEAFRDGIYNQLKLLLQTPKKYLSATIKKEIHTHLTNFNWGETWTEYGEYLLGRAYADMSQRRQSEEDDERFWDVAEDHTDTEATNRFDEALELWESRLDIGKNKNRGYDTHGRHGHRAGVKRGNTELWSRPTTKRRQTKRLAKLGALQHQQRNDR